MCVSRVSEQSNDPSFVSKRFSVSISCSSVFARPLSSQYVPRHACVYECIRLFAFINNSVSLAKADPFSVVHITKIYIILLQSIEIPYKV